MQFDQVNERLVITSHDRNASLVRRRMFKIQVALSDAMSLICTDPKKKYPLGKI